MSSKVDEKVVEVLRETAELAEDVEITDATSLIELGIDSFVAIQVLVGLEESLGIQFPDSMLTPEIFETAGSLIKAIEESVAKNEA